MIFKGYRISFGGFDGNVVVLVCGDGCTTLNLLKTLNRMLENNDSGSVNDLRTCFVLFWFKFAKMEKNTLCCLRFD